MFLGEAQQEEHSSSFPIRNPFCLCYPAGADLASHYFECIVATPVIVEWAVGSVPLQEHGIYRCLCAQMDCKIMLFFWGNMDY